jgi:hypothetical protein
MSVVFFCYFRNVIDEDSGTNINGIRQNIIAKPITETFGKRLFMENALRKGAINDPS